MNKMDEKRKKTFGQILRAKFPKEKSTFHEVKTK